MQVLILLEPTLDKGFRARSGEPLNLSADGPTPAEALRNLQELIAARMSAGARLVHLDLPGEGPWVRGAGMFQDDPLFEDWQRAIAERRERMDADPDVP